EVLWFLVLIHEFSVKARRQADWDDPAWSMLDMGHYGSGARWHLDIAVKKNDLKLAEWVLSHGASANADPPSDPRFSKRSLHEEALRLGFPEMADLLVRYGATPSAPFVLEGVEAFAAACFRLDRDDALSRLAGHPEYLLSTEPIFAAARRDRPDVVELLLDLGTSIEIEDEHKQGPLHEAASHDSLRVAELLIERGAEIEPVETNWNNTPLDHAMYGNLPRMVEFLSRFTRDVFRLTWIGNIERLREVLNEEPDLAKASADDDTPLMWLPNDEARALEITRLLLAHGVDPTIRNKEGQTAADIARKRGLDDVAEVLRSAALAPPAPTPTEPVLAGPVRLFYIDQKGGKQEAASERNWDTVIDLMKEKRIPGLDARGQMTDALLERISQFDFVTSLSLQGSKQLTDAGLKHLARLPRLQHLDLSGCQITDRGLEVLRQLPELRTFHLYHQRGISDAGVANLARCPNLEQVDLMGTMTGDGAIRALTGKPRLRRFQAGSEVTDEGLALFHEFPVFKTWQGGEASLSLMEFAAEPNYLWLNLKAPFTNKGLANLAGLDGLFALNLFGTTGVGPFDDSHSLVTAEGLSRFADLPNLGWLGCCAGLGNDESMHHISAMPRLRMLSCQDAVAGDDGFTALSSSQTIEYIWGRRCYNLTGRGFAALARMPALRGLSVSCKNVDDAGLSALPRFAALKEFMPMDVPDDGFRHVGQCEQLEALECMYCKEMADAATEHIAGLSVLKSYRVWSTRITDRSLEILGRMSSLERLLFHDCAGITDAGLAYVAGLPRLGEVELEGLLNVTPEGAAVFPAHVRVRYST
ncbi:MAG TPA: ankyrin repeat domain-containing protein, partial [Blastocatellia bacterium]|nr:ankyrin repeat domain-containing protein [Blastocatellia bacterium]